MPHVPSRSNSYITDICGSYWFTPLLRSVCSLDSPFFTSVHRSVQQQKTRLSNHRVRRRSNSERFWLVSGTQEFPRDRTVSIIGQYFRKKAIGLGCDFIFAHVAQTTKMLPRCQGVIDFRQDGIKFHWIIKLRQYTATYWCNEYQTSAKICNSLINFCSKVLCEVSSHRNGH